MEVTRSSTAHTSTSRKPTNIIMPKRFLKRQETSKFLGMRKHCFTHFLHFSFYYESTQDLEANTMMGQLMIGIRGLVLIPPTVFNAYFVSECFIDLRESFGLYSDSQLQDILWLEELISAFCQVVITKCYHLFCNPCLQRIIETRHRKCPVCAASFGVNDVKPVYIWSGILKVWFLALTLAPTESMRTQPVGSEDDVSHVLYTYRSAESKKDHIGINRGSHSKNC